MRKLTFVFATIAALSFGASQATRAADMPVKASPHVAATWSWTGFYVGVNGGYGWQKTGENIDYFFDLIPPNPTNSGAGFNARGGFAGGQIGYNYQAGKVVWGIETDFQGSGIRDKFNQSPAPGAPCCGNPADFFAGSSKLNWFGTVRGRVGLPFDRTLIYVTGGLAYGQIEQSINAVNPTVPAEFFTSSLKQTRAGGVLGVGGEYKITPRWSAKAEYQYLDFGRSSLTGVNVFNGPDHTSALSHKFHTIRLGINYLFASVL